MPEDMRGQRRVVFLVLELLELAVVLVWIEPVAVVWGLSRLLFYLTAQTEIPLLLRTSAMAGPPRYLNPQHREGSSSRNAP